MKLTQAGKAYEPHIGGVETVMREVAHGAVDRGWQSRVVVASNDRRAHVESRCHTTVVRTPTLARPLSFPLTHGYGRALAASEADVLLIHEPTLLAAGALQARPRRRDRFGQTVIWWHSDIIRQRALAPLYGPVIKRHLDAADRIIVATPHHITSSSVLARYADKIDVIPYGIDLSRYDINPPGDPERADRVQRLRAELLPDSDDAIIVNAGRLARYKGISHLVAAFDEVRNAHLVVAGNGPCADEVRNSAATRTGRLTMLPHLDDDAFVDLLHAADVFVMPSIHNSEAFGIAQVEAMACGTPVVTYDLPTGVTWVNRHDETGLVAPLGDIDGLALAIQHLVDDPPYRQHLAEGAHRWAHATFDRRDMVDSVFNVFKGCGQFDRSEVSAESTQRRRVAAGSQTKDR